MKVWVESLNRGVPGEIRQELVLQFRGHGMLPRHSDPCDALPRQGLRV